jgi:hypothetical protein
MPRNLRDNTAWSKAINTGNPSPTGTYTESSEMRFRIPRAGNAPVMPPSQLSVSGIRGQKRQLWATQTMQDVISAKAFEQWTKDQTIPRTPDDIWSASDMRKAHTFKKRQWKLSKPDFKHLKLDTITPTASHKQARQIEASATQQNQQRVAGQARNEVVSEVKQEVERPSATGPKLQAQSFSRSSVSSSTTPRCLLQRTLFLKRFLCQRDSTYKTHHEYDRDARIRWSL